MGRFLKDLKDLRFDNFQKVVKSGKNLRFDNFQKVVKSEPPKFQRTFP